MSQPPFPPRGDIHGVRWLVTLLRVRVREREKTGLGVAAAGGISPPLLGSALDTWSPLARCFLAAGATIVFVGYATGLRGPGGVVPYPNHERMHVRFPRPG